MKQNFILSISKSVENGLRFSERLLLRNRVTLRTNCHENVRLFVSKRLEAIRKSREMQSFGIKPHTNPVLFVKALLSCVYTVVVVTRTQYLLTPFFYKPNSSGNGTSLLTVICYLTSIIITVLLWVFKVWIE